MSPADGQPPRRGPGRPPKDPWDKVPEPSGARKRRQAADMELTVYREDPETARAAQAAISRVMKQAGPVPVNSLEQIAWVTNLAALATRTALSTINPLLWKWAAAVANQAKAMGLLGLKAKYEDDLKKVRAALADTVEARTPIRYRDGINLPATARGQRGPRGPVPVP